MGIFNGEGGMSPADIAAVTGNNGFGGFGSDGAWWLLVLFLFAFNGGGWGNNAGAGVTYNVDSSLQRGFDQSAVMGGLNGINAGISNLAQTVCNGFNSAEIAAGNRQISDLQQQFAAQTANTAAINALQSQLAQCCCENRLATANLQSVIQSEACADRAAVANGLRDLLTAGQQNTQAILDKMCQQEIDAFRRENDNLRTQLNMQNLAASQAAQTAQLIADNTAQTQYIVNRVAPYPIPSYTVPNPYGTTT